MSQTRIRTDRFGDGWTVHVGPEANAIRQQIKAENLIACDLPTEEERRAAMIVDVEGEVGRRLGRALREPALVSDGAPLRGHRPAGFDPARGEAA